MTTALERQEEEPTQYPSLFGEVITMAVGASLIHVLVDIRRLARKKGKNAVLSDSDADICMNLPIKFESLYDVLVRNREILVKKLHIFERKFVDIFLDEMMKRPALVQSYKGVTCHYVGDSNPNQECVHAITRSSHNKRVALYFRGSITAKDWLQDVKIIMRKIPNPLVDTYPDQPDSLGVHYGFRDYLYGDAVSLAPNGILEKEKQKKKDESSKNKITEILDQVSFLLRESPDHRFYVSGHSLGGALALIASVEAATRKELTSQPITCVTFGNPKAGNYQFGDALRCLEREKKLRCLNIHHPYDLVPMVPDGICACYICSVQDKSFHHAGMIMKLHADSFDINHSNNQSSFMTKLGKKLFHYVFVLGGIPRILDRHFYGTYTSRLFAQEEELRKLYLNDFYNEKLQTGLYV
eukprot:CAMPEP_0195300044 /NCGR_PEP_ID=MMETSP0707-20130614/26641_1 /TAXON_ID=33640 /ORGANISM="Asterionellopsis glacialis, Strain CCMP134" /LENGTH=411 /DNA_ID=CAMNT_0040362615 /DNA_START=15 /DNA_END=1250 /DNA_ORIENTATION=-